MLWIKAFHIIAMVAWFAGLFYLPRLFVYHSMATDHLSLERFKIMERKLYYFIATPAMLLTVFLGLWLLMFSWGAYKSAGWLHAKLFLVVLLLGYHHACGLYVKRFARDENKRSSRFYRIFNEIPAVFLIVIVILVVVQPF